MSPEAQGGNEPHWTACLRLGKRFNNRCISLSVIKHSLWWPLSIHLPARPDNRGGGGHARGIIDEEGEEIKGEGRCRMMDIDDVGM